MSSMHVRLKNLDLLSDPDAATLDRLLEQVVDRVAGEIVQRERAPADTTRVILAGWAIRYQTTVAGHRQILNFLIPGDSIGLYGALLKNADSGVELITDCRLAEFPSSRLMNICSESPQLGTALCWLGSRDERFLEQQILRLGVMNATARIAHLLVELQRRLINAGVPPAEAMTMPLTQKLLADALGLSAVHVNRCCRKLVRRGLLKTGPEGMTLLEPDELKSLCGYDEHFTNDDAITADAVRKVTVRPDQGSSQCA
jgi:CRP-like cAMP-binding protein